MSFWRTFGFTAISPVETILDREHFTLEELLDEEEILQECKSQNKKLLDFLVKPETLSKIIEFITQEAEEGSDSKRRFKYPFLSCEILSSEVWAISEGVYANEELLKKLYGFFDNEAPLNPLLASYVSRVCGSLLQRKIPETLRFLKERQDMVEKFIRHLGSASVMDLLLKVIGCEETNEGKGALEWLCNSNLIPRLISKFDPSLDSEVHENASQALVDIVAVSNPNPNSNSNHNQTPFQSYYSLHPQQPNPPTSAPTEQTTRSPLMIQLESEQIVNQLLTYILHPGASSSLFHGLTVLIELLKRNVLQSSEQPTEISDLPPLHRVIIQNLSHFKAILEQPASIHPIHSTIGDFQPLGFYRLKVVEFIVSLVQTNYKLVCDSLLELNILNTCFDLFFQYQLNNFLHFTLFQMVQSILKSQNNTLKLQILRDCRLVERILTGTKENEEELQKEKGRRKGYMGFLTSMSAQIVEEAARNEEIQFFLNNNGGWDSYVENSLNPTRKVENSPLGGHKPLSIADCAPDEEEMAEASAQAIFTQYLAQQGIQTYQDLEDDDDDDYVDDDSNETSAFESGPFNRDLEINTNEKETFKIVDDDDDEDDERGYEEQIDE